MRAILILIALVPLAAFAAGEQTRLERAPIDPRDAVSIQRGVHVFVNYCLSCHGAEAMRYNRLRDLGLTEEQIRDNLLFGSAKIGDTMRVAVRKADAQEWFGIAPPDLSVIARARGADWLYTYLRTFYRDDQRSTGWNNLVFPGVSMPHVLYQLQGRLVLKEQVHADAHGAGPEKTLAVETPGQLTQREYDRLVADLVNYLVYMGEPARQTRTRIGYAVLIFLGVLFIPIYMVKREYWKDVH